MAADAVVLVDRSHRPLLQVSPDSQGREALQNLRPFILLRARGDELTGDDHEGLYFRVADDGRQQLVVKFATGAVQILATEP